jgi:3-deoxy-D-manno-octulosonic-acid transferase
MIEPAAYGVATCFGPNTWNFRDIVAALLTAEAAVVVNNERELEQFIDRCLTDPAFAAQLGDRARRFVATQLGATQRTVDLLDSVLPPCQAESQRSPLAA